MALVVVVFLGIPKLATAAQPTVQAPTGPMSGGVFTGTFTFATYIWCQGSAGGYNSSYSSSLEGTNTFRFYGAADGSLLVTVNGGGMVLITSCGDPLTGPFTNVATYTVTKDSTPPPPTPAPTPTPTPTHTPTPTPAPAHTPTPPPGGGGRTPTPTPKVVVPVGGTTPEPPPPPPTPEAAPAGTPAFTPAPTATPLVPNAVRATGAGGHEWELSWSAASMLVVMLVLLLVVAGHILRLRSLHEAVRASWIPSWLRLEPYAFRLRRWLLRPVPFHLRIHGLELPRRRGLAPHRHTGRILAHHHTSYPGLAFLILVATVLSAGVSWSTQAESSLLTLTVTGPPPGTSATIDDPAPGTHLSTSAQTVRGTCPTPAFVEVWRNGAFAGSTMCDINGLYALIVTLVPGQNDLVARDTDALGQYGPDSPTVTVFYDPVVPTPTPTPSATPTVTPAPTSTPAPTPAPTAPPVAGPGGGPTPTPSPRPTTSPRPGQVPPLLIDSARHTYQGGQVNEPVEWTVTASGGVPPYSLVWQWGDGSEDTVFAGAAGPVSHQHTYATSGVFQLTVRAKDTAAHEAVLQLVTIVTGAGGAVAVGRTTDFPGNLIYVWPLLILASLLVLSFWLGERYKLGEVRPLLVQPGTTSSG